MNDNCKNIDKLYALSVYSKINEINCTSEIDARFMNSINENYKNYISTGCCKPSGVIFVGNESISPRMFISLIHGFGIGMCSFNMNFLDSLVVKIEETKYNQCSPLGRIANQLNSLK